MAVNDKRIYQKGGFQDYAAFTGSFVIEVGERIFFNNIITGQVRAGYSITGDGVTITDNLPFNETVEVGALVDVDLSSFRIAGNIFKIRNIGSSAINVNIGTLATPNNYVIFPSQASEFTFINSSWVSFDCCAPSVPIGGVIAWHKDFPNTPGLPFGYVQCDGQVLSDSDSVYNGQTIPDLNGDARFLRGSSTSGTIQADAFQDHGHELYLRNNFGASGADRDVGQEGANANQLMTTNDYVRDPIQINSNGVPRVDDETRPVNMSVVWIMRIK